MTNFLKLAAITALAAIIAASLVFAVTSFASNKQISHTEVTNG